MIDVKNLNPERWSEARDLRLRSLKTDPIAFGSAYEEEENFPEDEWKRRVGNALYAFSDEKLVGSITFLFSDRVKTRHIARIFGVYVDPNYRGRGIGKRLLENALERIAADKDIVKIQLMANSKQSAAVALYTSAGFVVVGTLGKEIRVGEEFYDEVIMEKML